MKTPLPRHASCLHALPDRRRSEGRKRGARGWTLPEILAVCAGLSVLALMVHAALHSGLVTWKRSRSQSECGQNAMLALARLRHELAIAPAPRVVLLPRTRLLAGDAVDADIVAFPSSRDDDGDMGITPAGDPRFSRILIYWIDGASSELWETTLAVDPATAHPPTLPAPVARALEEGGCPPQGAGRARRVARHVRHFACRPQGRAFRIVVETGLDGFRSRVESSVLPLGRLLGDMEG